MAQLIEVTRINVDATWVTNAKGRQEHPKTIDKEIINVNNIENVYSVTEDDTDYDPQFFPETKTVIVLRRTEPTLRGFVSDTNPQYHNLFLETLCVRESVEEIIKLANK